METFCSVQNSRSKLEKRCLTEMQDQPSKDEFGSSSPPSVSCFPTNIGYQTDPSTQDSLKILNMSVETSENFDGNEIVFENKSCNVSENNSDVSVIEETYFEVEENLDLIEFDDKGITNTDNSCCSNRSNDSCKNHNSYSNSNVNNEDSNNKFDTQQTFSPSKLHESCKSDFHDPKNVKNESLNCNIHISKRFDVNDGNSANSENLITSTSKIDSSIITDHYEWSDLSDEMSNDDDENQAVSDEFDDVSYENDYTDLNAVFSKKRRFVDMPFYMLALRQFGRNHPGRCPARITDIDITHATDRGFNSIIYLKCLNCNYSDKIYTNNPKPSEELHVNDAAVIGILASGSTFSSFKTNLAAFDIPCPAPSTYIAWRQKFTEPLRNISREELYANALEEQRLARENGDVIGKDKTPFCTIITDGGYGKRSYPGGKYDSLGGEIAIIGYRTQKIIDIVIYNKDCSICTIAANKNVAPKDHECFENFDRNQSSTKMEADGVVEAFKRSRSINGLIYNVMIADDDSSTYKALIDADVYRDVGITVKKIKCSNHMFRRMGTKITQASKIVGSQRIQGEMGDLRDHVKCSAIKIRAVITSEVDRLRNDFADSTLSKDCKLKVFQKNTEVLRERINLAPYHVFGDHANCPATWHCDRLEKNIVPKLNRVGLLDRVLEVVSDLSKDAEHLLHKVHTNVVEQFFSIVRQYICNKGYNIYKRDDFEKRVLIASIHQATSGAAISTIIESIGKTVNESVKNLEEVNRVHRLTNAKSRQENKHIKKYHKKGKGTDKHYGPNANKPDKTEDEIKKEIKKHKDVLLDRQKNRLKLESNTKTNLRYQQAHKYERDMISSKFFGKICRMAKTTSCAKVVESIVCEPITFTEAYLDAMESRRGRALKHLEDEVIRDTISPCGLFVSNDKDCFFTCARPDGLVNEDSIVIVFGTSEDEENLPVDELLNVKREWKGLFSKENPQTINPSHPYYYDIQGQLQITEKKYCYFAVYTSHNVNWIKFAERIERNDEFWLRKMKDKLVRFYQSALVFEIVDSRAARNMPIREPAHIIEAKKKLAMKRKGNLPTAEEEKSNQPVNCPPSKPVNTQHHKMNVDGDEVNNSVSSILQQVVDSERLNDVHIIWRNNCEFINKVCSTIRESTEQNYSNAINDVHLNIVSQQKLASDTVFKNKELKRSFAVVNTIGDGNCFYRSVAELILNDEDQHLKIRLFCIDHFLKNLYIYCHLVSNGVFEIQPDRDTDSKGDARVYDFIKIMLAEKDVWANESSVHIICDALNIIITTVIVQPVSHDISLVSKYIPESPISDMALTLINVQNLHYLAAHRTDKSHEFEESYKNGKNLFVTNLAVVHQRQEKIRQRKERKSSLNAKKRKLAEDNC